MYLQATKLFYEVGGEWKSKIVEIKVPVKPRSLGIALLYGFLAQLVERWSEKPKVACSIQAEATMFFWMDEGMGNRLH